jgi:putative ABC transport system substrate-binding protein
VKAWASCWLVIVVLTATSISAAAQQTVKAFRVGVLSPAERNSAKTLEAFGSGLRDLGYFDGANIVIEYRLAAGDYSGLPAMAAELVRLPVDVIVTDTQRAAQIAREATRTIPIVAATFGADPVEAGLAKSLAHPGGNVTGFSGFGAELSGKRLQLLKETFPPISRIAVLRQPASPPVLLQTTEEAARRLGLQISPIAVGIPGEILAGFETAIGGGAEAVVVLPDAMFWNERARIVALAATYRMPAIYPEREYVDDGGLLSYGANVLENFRLAAGYVDKILKGAKPGDLPIQLPTRFELVVNLKTAQALGLTIPASILARADEVIE